MLSFVWRLSDWQLSVAYIGSKLSTERPRKTKIGTGVAHVTRDSDTTFRVKRSKVNGHQAALVGCSSHYILYMDDTIIITRASCCLSVMNIHGSKCAGRCRRKACRLWTGGGPQRAYSGRGGGISCTQLVITVCRCCSMPRWKSILMLSFCGWMPFLSPSSRNPSISFH